MVRQWRLEVFYQMNLKRTLIIGKDKRSGSKGSLRKGWSNLMIHRPPKMKMIPAKQRTQKMTELNELNT